MMTMHEVLSKLGTIVEQPLEHPLSEGERAKLRELVLPTPEVAEALALSDQEMLMLVTIIDMAIRMESTCGGIVMAYAIGRRMGRKEPRLDG